MESLLLTVTIVALVMIAYRIFRSERADGKEGLGMFAFKESIRKTSTRARGVKSDA